MHLHPNGMGRAWRQDVQGRSSTAAATGVPERRLPNDHSIPPPNSALALPHMLWHPKSTHVHTTRRGRAWGQGWEGPQGPTTGVAERRLVIQRSATPVPQPPAPRRCRTCFISSFSSGAWGSPPSLCHLYRSLWPAAAGQGKGAGCPGRPNGQRSWRRHAAGPRASVRDRRASALLGFVMRGPSHAACNQ